MEFSDGLAVAAIALALSTIFLGVLFYRWQTDQGREVTKTINDFAKEMHAVLGEIKGLTTGTREQLQEQFTLALKAAVGQDRALVAEDLADKLRHIEDRMSGLEESAAGQVGEELRSQIDGLREQVSSLAAELAAAAREASSAASFLTSAEPSGEAALLPDPREVKRGEKVTLHISGVALGRSLVLGIASARCEVRMPDGTRVDADFPPHRAPVLVFPDDFSYASTDLPGEYRVRAYGTKRMSFGNITDLLSETCFFVRNGQSDD